MSWYFPSHHAIVEQYSYRVLTISCVNFHNGQSELNEKKKMASTAFILKQVSNALKIMANSANFGTALDLPRHHNFLIPCPDRSLHVTLPGMWPVGGTDTGEAGPQLWSWGDSSPISRAPGPPVRVRYHVVTGGPARARGQGADAGVHGRPVINRN